MYRFVKQASIHLITSSDRRACQTLDGGQYDKLPAPDGAMIEIWLKSD
jgi:hypothetical protein